MTSLSGRFIKVKGDIQKLDTGDLGAAAQAGAWGALSGGVFAGIGSAFNGTLAEGGLRHIGSHAIAGGILNVLQGGKFGSGFVSAGLTKFTGVNAISKIGGDEWGAILGRTAIAATVGGTVSAISGGKFANGARTAAYAHLLNQESGRSQSNRQKLEEIYNRKSIKGKTIREETAGEPFETIYDEGEWETKRITDMHTGDLFKGRILTVIRGVTLQKEQFRTVIFGESQKYNIFEYDTVYDLENGVRVNEMPDFTTKNYIETVIRETNVNIREERQSRNCSFILGNC